MTLFVDNGAGFQAISPKKASALGLPVKEYPETPLILTLGGGVKSTVPRKVTQFELSIEGFPVFKTEAFVMDIPEQCDILLGLPWFKEVNPNVDWKELKITPRIISNDYDISNNNNNQMNKNNSRSSEYQSKFKYLKGEDNHTVGMISRNPDRTNEETREVSLAHIIAEIANENGNNSTSGGKVSPPN